MATAIHSGFDLRGSRDRCAAGVAVFGALDETIAPILERTLRTLDLARFTRFQLDLAALESIDGVGLQLIQSLETRCARAGCVLEILAGATPLEALLTDETPALGRDRACTSAASLP